MDLDDLSEDLVNEIDVGPPNFLFWVQTVCDAMSFLGPETDADLARMIRLLLDHYAGEGVPAAVVDSLRHEIRRLRGPNQWAETTPLGLKYRCLNAIASSREASLADLYNWVHGVETAFQIINHYDVINPYDDKEQLLIQFIRERAREQKVDMFGKERRGG